MIRGLVIGKFMPVHEGHIALISFAASQCTEVIVSMSFTAADPINPHLRFAWLKNIFQPDGKIKVHMVSDDFDDDQLPVKERTKTWSDFIRKTYPEIDIVFSSEEYGNYFADHLGAKHIPFDYTRTRIAVSASLIRENPMRYWHFIPDVVRPYFVKKFCIYGPESTGKSTLTKTLAEVYHTEFVPEVAREMITKNDFNVEDIINIGRAQTWRIFQKIKTANRILFCDTDLITTEIYSQHYLKVIPQQLYDLEKQIQYDHYFLLDIDVPWIADGLRDLGNQREQMYKIFQAELDKRKVPYTKVQGTFDQREKTIRSVIDQVLSR
jgi:HTH-type transcriptional repressor of NAD biosynthesis genes